MTKQIYRMKSFWCILAALLLVALCVVAWMVGTARATAGSPATIVAVNNTIYTPGAATGNTQFSFNTENGVSTLTLNNFTSTTYNFPIHEWGQGATGNATYDVCREWSFIWADGDLTIEVNGENHLDIGLNFAHDGTTGLATRGIYVDGDLTIKGTNINDSVLYVDGDKNASYDCTGIYATGKITIQNCTIVAETEYSGNNGNSFGICAGTSMEITNADVTANPGAPQGTGGCHGIYAKGGQLTIDNSTVNATAADTSSWGVGIRTSDGNAIIRNNSQVTATSAKGYYYSAGIHIDGQLQIISSTVKSDSGEAREENSRGICAVDSGNDALIISNSKVEATGGQTDGEYHSCGIWATGNMIVSSDESLSLNASDMVKAVGGKTIGAGNSYGIYTQSGTLTVTCNSAVSEGYYHINADAGEAMGAGESAGIHCQATDVKGNAIVNATGGNSSSGTSVGIYADLYVEIHDTSEVTAKGGTANSSYGIQTAAGFYVRTYDYATLTAMGGVATSDFSTGIHTSGVRMYGGTIKAYGGIDRLDDQGKCVITTQSANACGIRLIPTGMDFKSRYLEIKDGNLHALGAETVTSGGRSYGIWREADDYTGSTSTGVEDTDVCNFRVHAGVVRADGATQAILMPANAALSGTPDTYVVCISMTYGWKAATAIVPFETYTFDSSHKRVDIEPHDYCNFPVPYLDAGGEKKICYNARFFRGNDTSFNAQQERWYVANQSWTTDGNGDPKIKDALNVFGNVHLILQDGVTVRCEKRGIHVTGDNKLTIYSQSLGDQMGKLYAKNAMEVQAVGCGAGIGGYVAQAGEDAMMPKKSGTITINGGEIHATGSAGSAGIGGCFNGEAGEIVINNGKIIANGGHFAAGIGSGDAGYATKITINGGYVKSTGYGRAAGIGGGGAGKAASQCPGGGIININGGYVEAYGGTGYNNGIYWNFEYLSMELMAKIYNTTVTEAKALYGTHSYDPTNPNANEDGYVAVEKGQGDFAYNEDYQLRRIPSAIGDGMGSTDTIALRDDGSEQSTASQVSIKNAVVVVNHQHKKNILGNDYWSLSEDVLFIENFTNPYDFAVDWNHAQTTDSQAYWVAKDENGNWKNSDGSWAKELGQVTCPADSAAYANYQAILNTTIDSIFDLCQDVTLPADMTVTLTVQRDQQFNANGHTFGVKTVLVQDRDMSIPVFTNAGNVSVGKTYYEIVYTAIDATDKDVISITDKDGVDGAIRNSHTYAPQDSVNKIEQYAKDLEMTDLRYYGLSAATIRVDPKPGTYVWNYVTSPDNLGFAAINQTLAHQFTMPATIVSLVKPADGEIQKVQFFGDHGAVTEGKVYTSGSIGDNGSVNILANGSFTAHFSGLSYFYQGVTFEFTPALPVGTKLVLMDRSGSAVNQGMVYAYTTTQNDINVATNTTSIPASSFVRMTSGDHLTLDDVRLRENGAIAFRLSVELPDDPAKNASARNYTVCMKDGNTKIGNVIVHAAADYAGKVESFVYAPAPGTISGQVNISGIKGPNNVLVVQLKDENGAVIPLPLGAQITLDGDHPTSYGENGVIFAGIDPGKTPEDSQISKTLTITHLPADKYYLCMAVCEAPQNSFYPMSQAGAWGPANQLDTLYEVVAVVPEAIQITCDDQVIDRDSGEASLTLTVTSSSEDLSYTTKVQIQNEGSFVETTKVALENSIVTPQPDAPAGLYRIVFTLYGGTVQYFYFIIT